ncbi:hypothetical protein ACFQMF_04640 [Halorubrum rutilum]|uniref:DUF7969 domain-containing protein n=1 Tax=Halorubrum rutilum TaxID=1364933 RepID=A0ABD6AIN7_9EURY|nr:hypothetical protein [Halorubrum rutilum]
MSYPVTYYCPHCGTIVELERDGYLADKAVTPYPFEGWTYVAPAEPFEDERDVDGVRFVCGESDGAVWDPRDGVRGTDVGGEAASVGGKEAGVGDGSNRDGDGGDRDGDDPGCGEPFYLSFVRYDEGREVDPRAESELVEIDPDPRPSGPRGPGGPSGVGDAGDSDGGFW